jgi:SOS response regulatory protein OraA/RecX
MPDLSEQAFNSSTDGRPSEIRRTAMDLLARREHSRRELKQKLKKRFRDDALIEEQLDTLAEENLQSDTRYAESFLRQRFNRGHGPVRIRQEMRQKGIPDSIRLRLRGIRLVYQRRGSTSEEIWARAARRHQGKSPPRALHAVSRV